MDFVERLDRSNSTVVFAFSSSAQNSRWEFDATLEQTGLSYVLLCDRDERWYQHGVDGIGNISDVALYMADLSTCFQRSVTLGLSTGSYGALMFGQMVPVDVVVAMSPVTGMGEDVHPDFDAQWHHRVYHSPDKAPVQDLKPLFVHGPIPMVYAFAGDGPGTELDARMATRIGAAVQIIPGVGHEAVARHMRDTGMLSNLLRRIDSGQ